MSKTEQIRIISAAALTTACLLLMHVFAIASPGKLIQEHQGGLQPMTEKVQKSDQEWQKELTPDQFRIARKKGTEPAFTGEYWNCHKMGVYKCVCCGAVLFDSRTKFDSGTGWPSFWAPAKETNVSTETDKSHGMTRTEVTCSHCGAHLGHLFDDGPAPTNQRYCINSASLKLEEKP